MCITYCACVCTTIWCLCVLPSVCLDEGDGDCSLLERLPLTVCSEVPEAGRVPGQPET